MESNLHKKTKVNLADSSPTTTNDSTNAHNKNNNNDNETASVITKEEKERKESNIKNKGKRKGQDINECESDDSDNIQNIEQQPHTNVEQTQQQQQQQQVVDYFFSGDVIIHQLLQASNFFFQLDSQTVLSLTLTSKTLFKTLSSLISQHFTFHHKHTPLIHYHPKKLRVQISHISGLFDNPYLSNVTKIEFTANNNNRTFSGLIPLYFFDQAITNLLSLNLTHLTIECDFNQPINSLLRNSKLTHLKFSSTNEFNYPVDDLLPHSLTHFTVGYNFRQPIDQLPPHLTHLDFEFADKFNNRINHLPVSLVSLKLGELFDRPINLLYLTRLTHLEFNYKFSQFNHPIDNLLPASLTHLLLGRSYNYPIDNLPPNLIHLRLGSRFKQSINQLPPNITHLTMPKYKHSQYKQIKKMPSILYFNEKPLPKKQNSSDEEGNSTASSSESESECEI